MEIPTTMRAATIVEFNGPIQIRDDVEVPTVPADRILIKIEAASLCSTDLMAYKGYMSFMTKLPYCGGHEPVGTVAKLGTAVSGFSIGDRVGFLMFTDMCGTCEECFSGQHRYCTQKKVNGFMDSFGGFSEYSLAHPASTVKLPDGLDFEVAAPLFCAGITAYSALLKGRSRPGQLINIVGCGGVGHVAILFAKAMGYRVNAYDIAQDKLDIAKKCGADEALDVSDTATSFEKAATTIIISGANQAYNSAANLTSTHGVVLGIGLPPKPLEISIPAWGSRDLTFIPCSIGSNEELKACLDLATRHNIKPLIEVRGMDLINEGYKDLAEGKVEGRLVFKF